MVFGIRCRYGSVLKPVLAGFTLMTSTTISANGQDNKSIDQDLEDASYSEEFFFQEVSSVITATRLQQSKAQTPASVTVIDRAMIEASGFVEIVDLLRLVPGFQVAHADGRLPVATSHGQSSQYQARLQVLVDGRSVYLPFLSNVDWTALGIQIDDIERIEVIRGPNAPAYGANAFIGAVNIITRQPFLDRGNYASVRVGDPGMGNVVLRHGGDVKGMDYRITGNYRSSDGYGDQDDEYQLSGISFRGTLSLTPADEFEIQLGLGAGHTGTGFYENPDPPRNVDSQFQLMKLRHRLSSESDMSIQFYHNYYRTDDSYSLGLVSEIFGVSPAAIPGTFGQSDQKLYFAVENGKAERYDLELQHSSVLGPNLRLVWGAGLRHDSLSSKFLLGKSDAITDNSERLFLNSEIITSKNTTLNLGIMVEHGDIVDTQYSPRLGFNWAVNPRHIIRASISTAHRNPALLDNNWNYAIRFADGSVLDQIYLTDEKLDSEKIRSLEIGYLAEFPEKHLSFETKLFYEKIEDILTIAKDDTYSDPVGNGSFLIRNGGYLDIRGIDGQIMYRPSQNKFIAFQYGYAEAESLILKRLDPVKYVNFEDLTPTFTASLLAGYQFAGGLNASIGMYHIDEQEWSGEGDKVPAYDRIDFRLAQAFPTAHGNGELSFVLQNILDDYVEFREQNLFGTRAYIQFKWSQ